MFAVRIGKVDHYLAPPVRGMDACYSDFRSCQLTRVPVVRIFGSTPIGQKVCVHVHGVFPYFLIPYDGTQPLDRYTHQLAVALEQALLASQNAVDAGQQHVYKVELVTGTPFYGFHGKKHQFLKISFINPDIVSRAIDLLQNGAVLNRPFQPHEAHVPFILQMFIDHNLSGMNLVRFGNVKFRQSPKDVIDNSPSQTPRASISSNSTISSQKFWNPDTIPNSFLMDKSVVKVSSCELELDAMAAEILNVKELTGANMNPGIQAIWEDEKMRRRQMNESSQVANPCSQDRQIFEPRGIELAFIDRLRAKLENATFSQETQLGLDDSQVHDNSGVECNPLDPDGVSKARASLMSPLLSQRSSQQSFGADDQEILNLIMKMVEDDACASSPSQTLSNRPYVVADGSEDEEEDTADAQDELTMSQVIWDTDPGLAPSAPSVQLGEPEVDNDDDDSLDWSDDIPQVDGPTDPPDRVSGSKKPTEQPAPDAQSEAAKSKSCTSHVSQTVGKLSPGSPHFANGAPTTGVLHKSELDEFGFSATMMSPLLPSSGGNRTATVTKSTAIKRIVGTSLKTSTLGVARIRPVTVTAAATASQPSTPTTVIRTAVEIGALHMSPSANVQKNPPRQRCMLGIRRITVPSQTSQTKVSSGTPSAISSPKATSARPVQYLPPIAGGGRLPTPSFNASFAQFVFGKKSLGASGLPTFDAPSPLAGRGAAHDETRSYLKDWEHNISGASHTQLPFTTHRLSPGEATKSAAGSATRIPASGGAATSANSDFDVLSEDGIIGSYSPGSKNTNFPSLPFSNLVQAMPSVMLNQRLPPQDNDQRSLQERSASKQSQMLGLHHSDGKRTPNRGRLCLRLQKVSKTLTAKGSIRDPTGLSHSFSGANDGVVRLSASLHAERLFPPDLKSSSGNDCGASSDGYLDTPGRNHVTVDRSCEKNAVRTPSMRLLDDLAVDSSTLPAATASPRVCVRGVSVEIRSGATPGELGQLGREMLVLQRVLEPAASAVEPSPGIILGSATVPSPALRSPPPRPSCLREYLLSAGPAPSAQRKKLETASNDPVVLESIPKVKIVKRERNDWSVEDSSSKRIPSPVAVIADPKENSADVTTKESGNVAEVAPANPESIADVAATQPKNVADISITQPENVADVTTKQLNIIDTPAKPLPENIADVTIEPPLNNADVTIEPPLNNADVTIEPPLSDADVTIKPPLNDADVTIKPPLNDADVTFDGAVNKMSAQSSSPTATCECNTALNCQVNDPSFPVEGVPGISGRLSNSDERNWNSLKLSSQLSAMPLVKLKPLDESLLSYYASVCDAETKSATRSRSTSWTSNTSSAKSILKLKCCISSSDSESEKRETDTSHGRPRRITKPGPRAFQFPGPKSARTSLLRGGFKSSESVSFDYTPPTRKSGPLSRRALSFSESGINASPKRFSKPKKQPAVNDCEVLVSASTSSAVNGATAHGGTSASWFSKETYDKETVAGGLASFYEMTVATRSTAPAPIGLLQQSCQSFVKEDDSTVAVDYSTQEVVQSDSASSQIEESRAADNTESESNAPVKESSKKYSGAQVPRPPGRGRGWSLTAMYRTPRLSPKRPSEYVQRPGPLSKKLSPLAAPHLIKTHRRLPRYLKAGRGHSIARHGRRVVALSAARPRFMNVAVSSEKDTTGQSSPGTDELATDSLVVSPAVEGTKSRVLQLARSTRQFPSKLFKRRVVTEQSRKANTLLQRAKGKQKKVVNLLPSQGPSQGKVGMGAKFIGQTPTKQVYQFGGRKGIAAEAITSRSGLRTVYKIDPADDIRIIPWPADKGFVVTQLIKNTQLRYTVRGADKDSKPPPNQIWMQDQNGRYSIVVDPYVRKMNIDTLNPYISVARLDRQTIFNHTGEMPPDYPKSLRMKNRPTFALRMMSHRGKGGNSCNKENRRDKSRKPLLYKRRGSKKKKSRWGSGVSSSGEHPNCTDSEDQYSDTEVYHDNRWRDLYPINHRRPVASPSAEIPSRMMAEYLAQADADAAARAAAILDFPDSDDESVDKDYVSVASEWEYGGGVVQNLTRLKDFGHRRRGSYNRSGRRKISANNIPQYRPAPPTFQHTSSPRTCHWYSPQREQPESDEEVGIGAATSVGCSPLKLFGNRAHELLRPVEVASSLDTHYDGSKDSCICPADVNVQRDCLLPLSVDFNYWQLTEGLESEEDHLGAGNEALFHSAYLSPLPLPEAIEGFMPRPMCTSPTENLSFFPFSHPQDDDDVRQSNNDWNCKYEYNSDTPRVAAATNWADVCAWNRRDLTDDDGEESEDLSASISIPISGSFSETSENLPCSSLPISFVEGDTLTENILRPPTMEKCVSGYPELDPAALAFCSVMPPHLSRMDTGVGAPAEEGCAGIPLAPFPVNPDFLADPPSINSGQIVVTSNGWFDSAGNAPTRNLQHEAGSSKEEFDFSLFEADEGDRNVDNAWNGIFVDPSLSDDHNGGDDDNADMVSDVDCDLEKLKNDLDVAAFLADDLLGTSLYDSGSMVCGGSSAAADLAYVSPSVVAADTGVAPFNHYGFLNQSAAPTALSTSCHVMPFQSPSVECQFSGAPVSSSGAAFVDDYGRFPSAVATAMSIPDCLPLSSLPSPPPMVSHSGENSPEMFADCWNEDLNTFEKFQGDALLPFSSSTTYDTEGGAEETAVLPQAAPSLKTDLRLGTGQVNRLLREIPAEAVNELVKSRSVLHPIVPASITAQHAPVAGGTIRSDGWSVDGEQSCDRAVTASVNVVSQETKLSDLSSACDQELPVPFRFSDDDDVIPPTPQDTYSVAAFGSSQRNESASLSETTAATKRDFFVSDRVEGRHSPYDFLGFDRDIVQSSRLKLRKYREAKRNRACKTSKNEAKDGKVSTPLAFAEGSSTPKGVAGRSVSVHAELSEGGTPICSWYQYATPNSNKPSHHSPLVATGMKLNLMDLSETPIKSFYQFSGREASSRLSISNPAIFVSLNDSETNSSTAPPPVTTASTVVSAEGVPAGTQLRAGNALLEYPIRPPSPNHIRATLHENGLTEVRHPEPFCSDPRDVPTRAVQHGGGAVCPRLRHEPATLPSVDSKLSNTGLENWKLLLSFGQADGDFECPSHCPITGGMGSHHVSPPPSLYRGLMYVPASQPPPCTAVTKWLDSQRQSTSSRREPDQLQTPAVRQRKGALLSDIAEGEETAFLPTCSPIGSSLPQRPPVDSEEVAGFGNVRHSTPAVGGRRSSVKRKRPAVALDFGRSDVASTSNVDTEQRDALLRGAMPMSPINKRANSDGASRLPELSSDFPDVCDDGLSLSQFEHNYARDTSVTEATADLSNPVTPACSPTVSFSELMPSPRCLTQERSADVRTPLQKILLSRKLKEDHSRANISTSQIDGPTPKNAFGFKLSAESLQEQTFSHLS